MSKHASQQEIMDIAPIPGQSLTDEPGNAKWEHPPQFTDLDDLLPWVFKKLTAPKALESLSAAAEQGIPVEALSVTLMMTLFAEGIATPDLLELAAANIFHFMARLSESEGHLDQPLKVNKMHPERGDRVKAMAQKKLAEDFEKALKANSTDPAETPEPTKGFVDLKGKE